MLRLFAFLYRYRIFGFFLFLEFLCIWMLVSRDNYYNAYFFNSSNYVAGQISTITGNIANYVSLREINKDLADENASLRAALAKAALNKTLNEDARFDLTVIPARVVNNDFKRSENFITIDKGKRDGILPGMGVISDNGVVGVVRSASDRFATITSILHRQLMVSSKVKKTNTLCTVQWDAESSLFSDVLYVPRHIPLAVGDTIVTSGYNAIFPENTLIGIVDEAILEKESPFYNARLRLSNDFSSLSYVYVINNQFKAERDSLANQNGKD
jgi:rod shape-determining protein MreC